MAYKRLSKYEWTWQEEQRQRAVRHFPEQGTLIWSAWTDTSEGPMFDDGVRQTLLEFQQRGAPQGSNPPPDLLEALHQTLLPDPPTHPDIKPNRRWPRIFRR